MRCKRSAWGHDAHMPETLGVVPVSTQSGLVGRAEGSGAGLVLAFSISGKR